MRSSCIILVWEIYRDIHRPSARRAGGVVTTNKLRRYAQYIYPVQQGAAQKSKVGWSVSSTSRARLRKTKWGDLCTSTKFIASCLSLLICSLWINAHNLKHWRTTTSCCCCCCCCCQQMGYLLELVACRGVPQFCVYRIWCIHRQLWRRGHQCFLWRQHSIDWDLLKNPSSHHVTVTGQQFCLRSARAEQ